MQKNNFLDVSTEECKELAKLVLKENLPHPDITEPTNKDWAAACLYEYLREILPLLRRDPIEMDIFLGRQPWFIFSQDYDLKTIIATPWNQLPKDNAKQFAEALKDPDVTFCLQPIPPKLLFMSYIYPHADKLHKQMFNCDSDEDFEDQLSGKDYEIPMDSTTSHFIFTIDFKRPQTQILAAFEHWLECHKDRFKFVKEHQGIKTLKGRIFKDRLHDLIIRRLHRTMEQVKERATFLRKIAQDKSFLNEKSNWEVKNRYERFCSYLALVGTNDISLIESNSDIETHFSLFK